MAVVSSVGEIGPEGIARELLQRAGAGAAPDARELAIAAGLRPLAAPEQARAQLADDGTLRYRANAENKDRQRWVAQQLARWLLQQRMLELTVQSVAHTAAALLLPREPFVRHCDRLDWNLRALQPIYPNATLGTLALRVAMLYPAVATWMEQGKVRWRFIQPRSCSQVRELTQFERHLAEIALETNTVLHPDPHVWSFPLNRNLMGVILLCDAERLLERDRAQGRQR